MRECSSTSIRIAIQTKIWGNFNFLILIFFGVFKKILKNIILNKKYFKKKLLLYFSNNHCPYSLRATLLQACF